MTCKHTWEELGETRQNIYEWCEKCGAIRKTPVDGGKAEIHRPQISGKVKQ